MGCDNKCSSFRSPSYTLVNAVRITSETALLSSIIGLAGLLGFYGSVFYVIETYCVRTSRVTQQVRELKTTRQRRVSIDAEIPYLSPMVTERRLSLMGDVQPASHTPRLSVRSDRQKRSSYRFDGKAPTGYASARSDKGVPTHLVVASTCRRGM